MCQLRGLPALFRSTSSYGLRKLGHETQRPRCVLLLPEQTQDITVVEPEAGKCHLAPRKCSVHPAGTLKPPSF